MALACNAGIAGQAELDRDGYALIHKVLSADERQQILASIASLAMLPARRAGSRDLLQHTWCQALAKRLPEHPALAPHLAGLRPVQCTLFDKSGQRNWLVSWHQDLSLPVIEGINASAWSGHARKQGQPFAQPPAAVLASALAVRVHLDANTARNGPLRLLPGTHRQGRLSPQQIRALRDTHPETRCLAPAGSALAMRPLLLHASSRAEDHSPRRTLHFVFVG